jgi:thiamine biosynthesis lipoprotein
MERFRYTFPAMAGENVIELYASRRSEGDEAARAAIAEVRRIEAKYSRYRDDSVTSAINRAAGLDPVEIDAETGLLLDYADTCFRESEGKFDITSGVLRRAWNFRADRPPSRGAIEPLLSLIGWSRVTRDTGTIRLPTRGMELDFGGFGKEYAADRAAAVLLSHRLHHAFVNLGGDVVVTGPQADGTPWQLGIRHPRREGVVVATLPILSGAVATSGDYERFLDYEGRRYSHILDPATGESVHGCQSVTAFAPTCLVAGSVTTIAMLRGDPQGLVWLESSGAAFLAIGADGRIHRNR